MSDDNLNTRYNEYLAKAKCNDAEFQYYVGLMLLEGIGVCRDEDKAIYWIEKAIEGGNQDAKKLLTLIQKGYDIKLFSELLRTNI